MEGSITNEQARDTGDPVAHETARAQRADKLSTQIGPVITSTHAERLVAENTEDYERAQEMYEHMDWAPTPEA